MRRALRSGVAALGLCVFITGSLLAQSEAITGVIEGVIYDPTGAPLAGAAIAIKNTATNYVQNLTTSSEGRFRAFRLPPGPYHVTISAQGFTTIVREGLDLSVGQTISLNLKTELASVKQEITVSGDAPVVETSRIEAATRLNDQVLTNLPNSGHNIVDFTKLTPGVSTVQGPDGDEVTVNGQKGIHNNVSVDGADFNNPFFGEQRGGQRPAFTFNLDAVQEVVVVADGANAEYGRSSSGFVNVITKSGTNLLQGTAHYFYTSSSLSATPTTAQGIPVPQQGDRSQVGATLGGPIVSDKVFFFASGDFNIEQTTKQNNPLRIQQDVVNAFAAFGSPNENGSISRTNDARVALGKIDWQINPQNLATVRYNYTWANQDNGTFDVDSWGRSANAIENDYSNAVTGSLLSTFSGNTSNEFRGQWAREDRPRPYNGPLITGQTRPLPDTAFDFARSYRFGEPFFIPVQYYDTRFQFNDNLTYAWGQHTFKAGAEYNQTAAAQTFVGFANGRFIFSSTEGFLNYVANPSYVECTAAIAIHTKEACFAAGGKVTGPVIFYLQQAGVGNISVEEAGTQTITQKEPAVFIQDVWQPLPNLTIQAGLRWEAQIEPDPITPPSQVFYAPFIGTTSKGQAFPGDGTAPSDWTMFQPRLGVSFDPWNDGKTALRGTFGLYYARIPGLVLASSRSTNGSRGQSVYRDSTFANFGGPLPPAYPNLIPASEIGNPDHPDVFVISSGFRNPRTTAFSLSGERQLMPGLAVSLRYANAATDFLTRFINRNDVLLGSPWATGLGANGLNGIGTLTSVESTAYSRYWGLTFGVVKQFQDNIGFQLNYTYSKDHSDDDNERDPFQFFYAKVTDLGPEYSLSSRDQTHRLNAWLLWQAPGQVLFNASYSYLSAQPKSITAAGLDAQTPQDRCSAKTASGGCTPTSTVTQRNLGRKDNQYSALNLRVSRVFQIARSFSIEPGVDVFNVFNSTNLRRPQTTNLIFNFDGTVQAGVGSPRAVQFGARVAF